MVTAALITAAGMSSRMGEFKPMLNIGSISVAQRVIANFQQAGVDRIVMVTGFNALELERHLSGKEVVFIRNDNFATTDMFDSVCIGLDYLRGKCDRVLFTPVDIPLFTAATVQALLNSKENLVSPVCDGVMGHPTLISATLISKILNDSGDGGLRGALSRTGEEHKIVNVKDEGVLLDADTPDDFRALLRYHNSQLSRPSISIALAKEKVFFDAKTAMLLRLVDDMGSVRSACQHMRMSYSSGWSTIRTLEEQTGCKLICRNQGGKGGGNSYLTVEGKELLNRYEAFSLDVRDEAARLFTKYFEGIF